MRNNSGTSDSYDHGVLISWDVLISYGKVPEVWPWSVTGFEPFNTDQILSRKSEPPVNTTKLLGKNWTVETSLRWPLRVI